ncbi:hypothetical protein J2T56_002789 [Natronobacillus azotifigens]|uniref:SurA N-terminal domain-containing protein n=1 Tax=Natronobacillus azotifigens TaxID=472978 RepID=A0A9J6RGE3_9BACI|nr:SurA N-terminal domain-containing protein [Natronobacillus azotifigens]MCZ0704395.1 SurA N-terminal domain-containing protein [Natronobacillus azotifigens]
MKTKKIIILFSGLFFLLVILAPMALADDFGIGNFFSEKEQKLEGVNSSDVLVKGENFTITQEEFVDHKENLKMIYELNDISLDVSNEEVIDQIVENKLLLKVSDEQGIEVTKNDVQEYALQTRKAFEEENISKELKQIHLELAKQLNVSPEEYFTHPDVLKQYEDVVKINKLVDHMELEGTLNDKYSLSDFVHDLKVENKDTLNINKQALEQFE